MTAKVSVSDGFKGGVTTDESLDFTAMLEADGYLDALQLSGGSSLMNPMYLFRGETPDRGVRGRDAAAGAAGACGRRSGKRFLKEYEFHEAYFLDKALRFRERLSMPLMLLGGINRRDTMEQAMAHGFDFVAMGRALLREPDLVNAARRRPPGRRRLHPLQPVHADHLLRHPLLGGRRRSALTGLNPRVPGDP